MRWRTGIIAVALATVSCGGGGSGGESSEATTPRPATTQPVAEGSYESVQDMATDVQSTFYLCSAPIKTYEPPLDDDALAQADCSSVVGLLIYEPGDVQASAADILASADGASALLVGDNWIITCSSDEALCEQIQGGTGGELIVTP